MEGTDQVLIAYQGDGGPQFIAVEGNIGSVLSPAIQADDAPQSPSLWYVSFGHGEVTRRQIGNNMGVAGGIGGIESGHG